MPQVTIKHIISPGPLGCFNGMLLFEVQCLVEQLQFLERETPLTEPLEDPINDLGIELGQLLIGLRAPVLVRERLQLIRKVS
jgi:hypothetical protein